LKIAILHLNNYGDILYATPVARQIKKIDFPGAHLTWIVVNHCAGILKNNEFIDQLEIIEISNFNVIYAGGWENIHQQYKAKLKNGEFDKLFVLQPYDRNFLKYKGSIRKMILDAYPFPINPPLSPIVYVTDSEKINVQRFFSQNRINEYRNRILFEFFPGSGQANISITDALNIAERILENSPSTCVILSSRLEVEIKTPNIFSATNLTFKENAELINNCTLLLGCSSGLTWLSTSEYCKKIPTVQFIDKNAPWFNSVKADFKINGICSDHIIELYDFDHELIIETVICCLNNEFKKVKVKYDQQYQKRYLLNSFYFISNSFLSKRKTGLLLLFLLKNLGLDFRFVRRNIWRLMKLYLIMFMELIRVKKK
jgi:ADP-heptose:LPS heptosyltransferase